jgi:apolipoprotein N-acyltransferase
MNVIATATTAADRLREIPGDFWLKALLVVVAFVVAILLFRKAATVNKAVFAGIIVFALAMVGFNWIYERNEPAWATPTVTWLSGFFPSKGAYVTKQQTPTPATKPVAAKRS